MENNTEFSNRIKAATGSIFPSIGSLSTRNHWMGKTHYEIIFFTKLRKTGTDGKLYWIRFKQERIIKIEDYQDNEKRVSFELDFIDEFLKDVRLYHNHILDERELARVHTDGRRAYPLVEEHEKE